MTQRYRLYMFEGILTAERYVSILQDHLVWGADEALGRGQWVFQQDNDAKHRAHYKKYYSSLWCLAVHRDLSGDYNNNILHIIKCLNIYALFANMKALGRAIMKSILKVKSI